MQLCDEGTSQRLSWAPCSRCASRTCSCCAGSCGLRERSRCPSPRHHDHCRHDGGSGGKCCRCCRSSRSLIGNCRSLIENRWSLIGNYWIFAVTCDRTDRDDVNACDRRLLIFQSMQNQATLPKKTPTRTAVVPAFRAFLSGRSVPQARQVFEIIGDYVGSTLEHCGLAIYPRL